MRKIAFIFEGTCAYVPNYLLDIVRIPDYLLFIDEASTFWHALLVCKDAPTGYTFLINYLFRAFTHSTTTDAVFIVEILISLAIYDV